MIGTFEFTKDNKTLLLSVCGQILKTLLETNFKNKVF